MDAHTDAHDFFLVIYTTHSSQEGRTKGKAKEKGLEKILIFFYYAAST